MYWRVKTVKPEDILRQYGVHLALAVSLLANFILFISRPNTNKVSEVQKQNFDQFARNVTAHLLDNSYISWQTSTDALLHGELAPSVVQRMQSTGDLPKSPEAIKAIVEEKTSKKEVSAIRIDQVNQGDPQARPNGPPQIKLIPVSVRGMMARHSADESSSSGAIPFELHFWMGTTGKDQRPIVADITSS